jgi:hypothetical protein
VSLYGFVGNDGVSDWDRLGLIYSISQETEVLLLESTTRVRSRPNSLEFRPLATHGGLAGLDLEVTPTCVCVSGRWLWKKWSLEDLHINFIYKAWLRDKSYYKSDDHRRWTRAAERDHLIDFANWVTAPGGGIEIGHDVYEAEKLKEYDEKAECELMAERRARSQIDTGFVGALRASQRIHDRGKHTWDGSNPRPVPPFSENVDAPNYFQPGSLSP